MKAIYNGYGEVRENHDGTVYMKPAPPPPRTPDNQGQISPTRACLVVSERPVSPARRRLGTEQLLETYSVACTMATDGREAAPVGGGVVPVGSGAE